MPVFQELTENARKVMRDMSVTQRLAVVMTGVTVALALGMMVFIGSLSEKKGTLPLPVRVPPKQYEEFRVLLEDEGISPTYERDTQSIHVPIEQVDRAYMLLARNDLFTDDSHAGFEQMLARVDYTITEPNRQAMMRVAKQNELSRIIQTMTAVESADVILVEGDRRRLGAPVVPRGSVMIRTAIGKEVTQGIADTIIALVAGTMAGLEKERVVVTDQDGRHWYATNESDSQWRSAQRLAQQRKLEEAMQQKVESQVRSFYPGCEAFAFVTAVLDLDTMETEIHKKLEGPVKRARKSSREQKTTRGPGAPVGTQPNVVRQTNTGGGPTEYSEYSEKDSDTLFDTGEQITVERKIPGKLEEDGLSVSVVMHLPAHYERSEEGEVVRDDQGEPVRTAGPELTEPQVFDLQRNIAAAIGHPAPREIEIKQVGWTPPLEGEDQQDWAAVMADLARQHLTALILAGFAVVGFVMIWTQVRRVVPAEELAALEDEIASPEGAPFGEVSDEDRSNQAFEQMRNRIADIVDEDPKKAASLVKRWMVME